jgi:hypothetical protein
MAEQFENPEVTKLDNETIWGATARPPKRSNDLAYCS